MSIFKSGCIGILVYIEPKTKIRTSYSNLEPCKKVYSNYSIKI